MNAFYKVCLLLLLITFFCNGCATIFHGTKQKINIDSKPQGATVKVKDKIIGATPLSVKLPTKKPLDIVFSYPGYEDRTYFLDHKYEWRILLLDVPATFPYINVPFAIDVITQSPYRFVEKRVMMNFDSQYVYNAKTLTPSDSVEVAKRVAVERELLKIEREMAALKREERRLFIEEERKRKLKLHQEKIRNQWLLDSTIAAHKRISYDSSRARNRRTLMRFNNSVSMEVTGMYFGESRLEYHRNVYNGMSLGIELGYKPAYYSTHNYSNQREWQRNTPEKEIMAMPFTESYYMGLATKIPVYALGKGKYYVSLVSFIRRSSFDHGVVSWNDGGNRIYHITYTDSVGIDQNTYGLKVLFGFRKIYALDKIGLEFDTYGGFSFRNVTTEFYHYKMTKTDYYYGNPPVVTTDYAEKIAELIPTFQLGVKVGLRF